MAILGSRRNKKSSKFYKQTSLLAAIPAILIVSPLIGFYAGRWADTRFETEPYLMITGIILGFGGAGVETYNLVKKASAIDREDNADQ